MNQIDETTFFVAQSINFNFESRQENSSPPYYISSWLDKFLLISTTKFSVFSIPFLRSISYLVLLRTEIAAVFQLILESVLNMLSAYFILFISCFISFQSCPSHVLNNVKSYSFAIRNQYTLFFLSFYLMGVSGKHTDYSLQPVCNIDYTLRYMNGNSVEDRKYFGLQADDAHRSKKVQNCKLCFHIFGQAISAS